VTDPFESTVTIAGASIEEIRQCSPELNGVRPGNSQGSNLFVYDLETVPDESRYPRPVKEETEPRDIDIEFALETVGSVEKEIALGMTPEQAEELLLAERGRKKTRKGVVDLLTRFIDGGDEDMQKWHKLGASPWHCRIVAMGVFHDGADGPESWIANNTTDECDLLREFWNRHEEGRRAGYNISGFDDLVIIARSVILNVLPGRTISLKKYGNKQALDLMTLLFPGGLGSAMKLKDLCFALGIHPAAGNTDGSQVLQMVDDGRWSDLENYVRSDVAVEMELYHRIESIIEI